jgi:hypothetical protein
MRVGLSLLTLVPGAVGGSETYVRGLARALAEVGELDYTAFVPPVAVGAGSGMDEVVVLEYRGARTIPDRGRCGSTMPRSRSSTIRSPSLCPGWGFRVW